MGPDLLCGGQAHGYAMAVSRLFEEFNGVLEETYDGSGVPVADVAGVFRVGEFPVSASLACAWTWICTPPPLGPDIHANSEGYGVIAAAFGELVRR